MLVPLDPETGQRKKKLTKEEQDDMDTRKQRDKIAQEARQSKR